MSEKWTADRMPDQSGRLAVVTGANSGLGAIVARELARRGARVVVACRNTQKGEAAAAKIAEAAPSASVEVEQLDLASLDSVREFANRFAARAEPLDLLVNNAGVMAAPYQRTVDGFELQFGTNHLGHFALTGLLLDALRRRPGARVVTVSSGAHKGAQMDFDDLNGERDYKRWRAYGRSKLANLLYMLELDRRLKAAGIPLVSVAAHPGYAATNLQLSAPPLQERILMRITNLVIAQSAEMGALPILYAAAAPDVSSGSYYGPDGRGEARGHPTLVKPSRAAQDPEAAARLWAVSEELTGVSYDLPAPVGT
jgi:NAD(P)-dependent dehydrogenase (short-subunit alcohol dehydrogenase family)